MKSGIERFQAIYLCILVTFFLGFGSPATLKAESTILSTEDFAFEHYEIDIGPGKRKTVLTGFLLGNPKSEIAVISLEPDGRRRLQIFEFDKNTWITAIDTTLRPKVAFLDILRIGEHDRLITYEPGQLNLFDPISKSEKHLLTVTTIFKGPRKDEIPWVDLATDVNGDGRDDLLLPTTEGFNIFVQNNDAHFQEPIRIGPHTDLSGIYGTDGYKYDPWSQSRIFQIDYNQDGRIDLAFWNKDHFEVHLQNSERLFSKSPTVFHTEIAFDSDRLFSLATGKMSGRILHSLCEMNKDGVTDLVLYSLTGNRITKKRSTYSVHYGMPTSNDGIRFEKRIGASFESDARIQLRMDRSDFDHDGQIDLMFTTIGRKRLHGNLWKTLKGMMGDDIDLNLEFHRTNGGLQSKLPNSTYRIGLDGAPSHREPGSVDLELLLRGPTHQNRRSQQTWHKAFNQNLFIGDVNGDNRDDLIMESTFRGLKIYPGIPGPSLFSPQSQHISVIVPANNQYSWLADLNADNKRDLLLHHPFVQRDIHGGRVHPLGTEPQKLTLLIAL